MRNPMKLGRSMGNAVITFVLLGFIFYQTLKTDRPQSDPNIHYKKKDIVEYFMQAQASIFVCITGSIMNGIFSVALLFPFEREVFTK